MKSRIYYNIEDTKRNYKTLLFWILEILAWNITIKLKLKKIFD